MLLNLKYVSKKTMWLTCTALTFSSLISTVVQAQAESDYGYLSEEAQTWTCPGMINSDVSYSRNKFMEAEGTADSDGVIRKLRVARGGVHKIPMPNGIYPAENTLNALFHANCLGYLVSEIDLRLTADKQVILMRDETTARTTDIDGTLFTHIPHGHSGITLLNGSQTQEPAYPTRLISSMFRNEIETTLTRAKSYDEYGRLIEEVPYGNAKGAFLDYILSNYQWDGMLLILDVADYETYKQTVKLIEEYDAWDFVYFKIPPSFFPVIQTSATTYKVVPEYLKSRLNTAHSHKIILEYSYNDIRYNLEDGKFYMRFMQVAEGTDINDGDFTFGIDSAEIWVPNEPTPAFSTTIDNLLDPLRFEGGGYNDGVKEVTVAKKEINVRNRINPSYEEFRLNDYIANYDLNNPHPIQRLGNYEGPDYVNLSPRPNTDALSDCPTLLDTTVADVYACWDANSIMPMGSYNVEVGNYLEYVNHPEIAAQFMVQRDPEQQIELKAVAESFKVQIMDIVPGMKPVEE